MTQPLASLRDVPKTLILVTSHLVLDDELWKVFRFRRRPQWTGTLLWPFLRPSTKALVPFLYREFTFLALGAQLHVMSRNVPRRHLEPLIASTLDQFLYGLDGFGDFSIWTPLRFRSVKAARTALTGGLCAYGAVEGPPTDYGGLFMARIQDASIPSQYWARLAAGAVDMIIDLPLVQMGKQMADSLQGVVDVPNIELPPLRDLSLAEDATEIGKALGNH